MWTRNLLWKMSCETYIHIQHGRPPHSCSFCLCARLYLCVCKQIEELFVLFLPSMWKNFRAFFISKHTLIIIKKSCALSQCFQWCCWPKTFGLMFFESYNVFDVWQIFKDNFQLETFAFHLFSIIILNKMFLHI